MPSGVTLSQVQTSVPQSTATAEAVIPQRQLYETVQQPTTAVNGASLNNQLFNLNVQNVAGAVTGQSSLVSSFSAGVAGSTLDVATATLYAANAAGRTASVAATQATAAATASTAAQTAANTAASEATAANSAIAMISPTSGSEFCNNLGDFQAYVAVNAASSTWRWAQNPNFWLASFGNSQYAPPCTVSGYVWEGASPKDNQPGEADVDMLNRLYADGSNTWAILPGTYGGLPYLQVSDSVQSSVFLYQPTVASGSGAQSLVHQFYELWDFVSSSGSDQNGIDVFMQFLALVPVQW